VEGESTSAMKVGAVKTVSVRKSCRLQVTNTSG